MEHETTTALNSCENDTVLIEPIKETTSQINLGSEGKEQYFLIEQSEHEQQGTEVVNTEIICSVEDIEERPLWSNICRICANVNDHLIPIFHGEGVEHALCSKIHKYLPIHITENDNLPLQLCYHCAATLLAWHDLVEGCLEAERRLMDMQTIPSEKQQLYTETENKDDMSAKTSQDLDRYGSAKKKSFAAFCSSQATIFSAHTIIEKSHTQMSPGILHNDETSASIDRSCEQSRKGDICREFSLSISNKGKEIHLNSQTDKDVIPTTAISQSLESSGNKLSVYSEKVYVCQICQHSFKRRFNLRRHLIKCGESNYKKSKQPAISVASNSPFNNEKCTDNSCEPASGILETVQNFKGDILQEDNGNQTQLIANNENKEVKKMHDKIKRKSRKPFPSYSCVHCDYTTNKKRLLETHNVKQHPEFSRVSSTKKSQSIDKELIRRARMEIDGKLYYHCDECGKNLYSPYTFSWHRRIHTGERPFTCHLCGKQFRVNQGLARHLKETHAGIKNFPCDICGRMFSTKRTAEDHRRIHTGERPYVCNVCGKTFTQKASLFVHNRIHTDSFPFKCCYCDLRFRTKPPLMIHITKHTGEKPYTCEICNRSFRIKYELKRHRLIHFDEKPWQCTECSRSFRQKRYLINHKKLNHRTN